MGGNKQIHRDDRLSMSSEKVAEKPTTFTATQRVIVVCQDASSGKFLAVKMKEKGWWMPSNFVREKENFFKTAIDTCKNEVGIAVKPEGILRVEYTPIGPTQIRMRLVLFVRPTSSLPEPTPGPNCEMAKW